MRRFFIIIVLKLISCMVINAQDTLTWQDIVANVKSIKSNQGDYSARNYLESKKNVFFTSDDAIATYNVFWGVLTSNLWNANPTDSLTKDYEKHLETYLVPDFTENLEFTSDGFYVMFLLAHDYFQIKYQEQDFTAAEKYITILLKWFDRFPDFKQYQIYSTCLGDYVVLETRDLKKYEVAYPYAKIYAETSNKIYGEKSSQYAVALLYLSTTCSALGKQEEKKSAIEKSMEIANALKDIPDNIYNAIRDMYNMVMALETGKVNAGDINQGKEGNLTYAQCAQLIVAGRATEALPSLINLRSQLLAKRNFDELYYFNIAQYMSVAYSNMGDFVTAQKVLEECLNKINFANVPIAFQSSYYTTLGYLAYRLMNYNEAIEYSKHALYLSDKAGSTKLEVAKILSNIGLSYSALGDVLKSKWYVDEAYEVCQGINKDGTITETMGIMYNNMGMVYATIGDTIMAEKLFTEIVENPIIEHSQPSWILSANNLSVLFLQNSEFQKSINLIEQIDTDGKEQSNTLKQNLAFAYVMTDNKLKARNALLDYNKQCNEDCLNVFDFFTQREREAFWSENAMELTAINNSSAEIMPDLSDIAYDNVLFTKNLSIHSSDVLRKFIISSNDEKLIDLYHETNKLRDKITYKSEQMDSVKEWTMQLAKDERTLLNSYPGYKYDFLQSFGTWQSVKQSLSPTETAVEFILIPKFKSLQEVEVYYGALILNSFVDQPMIISLCLADELNTKVQAKSNTNQGTKNLYMNTSSDGLYNLIWKRLIPYISGKTIYFSPTGVLNSINHNAILMSDNICMGDKYNLIRLSSTNKISEFKNETSKLNSATIYGGIIYDESVSDMTAYANKYVKRENDNLIAMRSEDERGGWKYLPGTLSEANTITELLSKAGINNTLYTDKFANEESFKSLSGKSPDVIHLSTHGFYIKSSEQASKNAFTQKIVGYSSKENNLTRTGILLAGANNAWSGKAKISGIEDGVVTADEISRMDLSNTKLVVLSACETASGYVDQIEGVMGLQRGFKKAGVQTIVMSLWQVSDAVTSLFMTEFYNNLIAGQGRHEALNNASKVIRSKYPDHYYWAAFVVLD